MRQDHPKLTRRLLLGGAAALPVSAALPATATGVPSGGTAARKDISAELLDQWAEAPGTHPLIPDISHAGYRGGERPRRPRVVARVTDFGARPGIDAAAAFNAAVRYAGERGGGTVVVPRGTFRLDSPLWMHWSNVVLKGSGSEDTVLHFHQAAG